MDTLNYETVVKQFPWIMREGEHCVVSPDSDGFLSALFMSQHLDWKVKGFYDGKVLLIEKGIDPSSVVFLDVEIYRKGVRSVGQHMLLPNKNRLPPNWSNFENCISANNLRLFDAHRHFQNKYPFGTIHLLILILGSVMELRKAPGIAAPLLYTDGTFKNLFSYPENCLSWFHFLRAKENAILLSVFFSHHTSIVATMELMKELFEKIKSIGGGRGGEKIKLSDRTGGQSEHIVKEESQVYLARDEVKKSVDILDLFATMTGWEYNEGNWVWEDFECFQFIKEMLEGTTSVKKRNALLATNPLSFAITATNRVEYTMDREEVFY